MKPSHELRFVACLRKYKSGKGDMVIALGIAFTVTIVGAVIGIPLILLGVRLNTYYVCSLCGIEVTKGAYRCSKCDRKLIST